MSNDVVVGLDCAARTHSVVAQAPMAIEFEQHRSAVSVSTGWQPGRVRCSGPMADYDRCPANFLSTAHGMSCRQFAAVGHGNDVPDVPREPISAAKHQKSISVRQGLRDRPFLP